jgi:SAM-dependent methyltransferase
MPIIPQNSEPHRARAVAESFGVDAERYDRTRPRYPQELIDAVVAGSPGTDMLDVGCGTGIAARQLRDAGCRVLGVEPDPRMAEVARRHGLTVEEGTFEEWDPSGRTFAAVVAGQAWHWIDPVAGAARAAGVLRPGGRLTVFWNVTLPPPDVAQAFAAVYQRVLPDAPAGAFLATSGTDDPYGPLCEKASDGIRQAGGFGEPQRWRFDREQHYSREQWLDLVPTMGGHTLLPPPVLDELLAGFGAAVDAAGGGFTMVQQAVAVTATRA